MSSRSMSNEWVTRKVPPTYPSDLSNENWRCRKSIQLRTWNSCAICIWDHTNWIQARPQTLLSNQMTCLMMSGEMSFFCNKFRTHFHRLRPELDCMRLHLHSPVSTNHSQFLIVSYKRDLDGVTIKYDMQCLIIFNIVITLPCSTLVFNPLTIS